jgi:hypothetical protein
MLLATNPVPEITVLMLNALKLHIDGVTFGGYFLRILKSAFKTSCVRLVELVITNSTAQSIKYVAFFQHTLTLCVRIFQLTKSTRHNPFMYESVLPLQGVVVGHSHGIRPLYIKACLLSVL